MNSESKSDNEEKRELQKAHNFTSVQTYHNAENNGKR